jgi:DNA-binding NarL/FixJ family response regulator
VQATSFSRPLRSRRASEPLLDATLALVALAATLALLSHGGGLRAGASGFLLKRTRPEELITAVHTIAAGESLLSPSVTRRVIDRLAAQPDAGAGAAAVDDLTPREREVLGLLTRGLSNAEIADALVIGPSTVKTHVKRILMKLGLRTVCRR